MQLRPQLAEDPTSTGATWYSAWRTSSAKMMLTTTSLTTWASPRPAGPLLTVTTTTPTTSTAAAGRSFCAATRSPGNKRCTRRWRAACIACELRHGRWWLATSAFLLVPDELKTDSPSDRRAWSVAELIDIVARRSDTRAPLVRFSLLKLLMKLSALWPIIGFRRIGTYPSGNCTYVKEITYRESMAFTSRFQNTIFSLTPEIETSTFSFEFLKYCLSLLRSTS